MLRRLGWGCQPLCCAGTWKDAHGTVGWNPRLLCERGPWALPWGSRVEPLGTCSARRVLESGVGTGVCRELEPRSAQCVPGSACAYEGRGEAAALAGFGDHVELGTERDPAHKAYAPARAAAQPHAEMASAQLQRVSQAHAWPEGALGGHGERGASWRSVGWWCRVQEVELEPGEKKVQPRSPQRGVREVQSRVGVAQVRALAGDWHPGVQADGCAPLQTQLPLRGHPESPQQLTAGIMEGEHPPPRDSHHPPGGKAERGPAWGGPGDRGKASTHGSGCPSGAFSCPCGSPAKLETLLKATEQLWAPCAGPGCLETAFGRRILSSI